MRDLKSGPTFEYFDDLNDAIVVVDQTGAIIYFNDASYDLALSRQIPLSNLVKINYITTLTNYSINAGHFEEISVKSKLLFSKKNKYYRLLFSLEKIEINSKELVFPMMYDHPGNILFIFNGLTRKIDFISKSAAYFFGVNYESLLQKNLDDLINTIHQEDRDKLEIKIEEILSNSNNQTKNRFEFECRVKNRYMEYRWFKISAGFYIDKYKRANFIVGFAQDISGQKNIEAKLIDNEKILQAITFTSDEAVFDYNLKTETVKYHFNFARILGYGYNEFVSFNSHWSNYIHQDDKKNSEENLKLHLAGTSSKYSDIFRIKTKKGDFKWVECKGIVTDRDEIGNPIRMIGVFKDINSSKVKEDSLVDFKILVDKIMTKSNEGLIIVNDKGVTINYNDAFKKITGLADIEIIGKTIWDIQYKLTPFDVKKKISYEQLKVQIQEFLRIGDGKWNGISRETILNRPDGTNCYVSTTVNIIPGLNRCALGTLIDVTGQKNLELEIEKTNKLLKELNHLSKDVFYKIDLNDLTYDYLSGAAEQLIGPGNSLTWRIGFNSFASLIHKDDASIIEGVNNILVNKNNNKEGKYTNLYRIKVNDNKYKWVEDTINFVKNRDELVVYGVIKDITLFVDQNNEIETLKEHISLIEEYNYDVILKLSENGVVHYSNKIFNELFNNNSQKLPEIIPIENFEKVKNDPFYVNYEISLTTLLGEKSFDCNLQAYQNEFSEIVEIIFYAKDKSKVKKTESALAGNIIKSNNLLDLNPAPCFELDNKGIITNYNSAAFKIFKANDYDLLGKRFLELADIETEISSIDPGIFNFDFKKDIVLKSTGFNNISEWIMRPLFESNTFLGALVVGVENANNENINRLSFQDFINSIPKPIAILDLSGKIVEWNTYQEQASSIKREYAIGYNIWDLSNEVNSDDKILNMHRVMIKGAIEEILSGTNDIKEVIEHKILTPNGDTIYTQIKLFKLDYDNTTYVGLISEDKTKDYNIINELRESEYKYKSAFINTPFPLIISDLNGIILHFNDILTGITGYYQEELIGSSILDLIAGEDFEKIIRSRADLLSGRIDVIFEECSFVNKNLEKIKAVYASTLVKDLSGRPIYFISQAQSSNLFKYAETEIEKFKLGFEKLVSKLPMMIWSVNREEVIDYITGSALDNDVFSSKDYIGVSVEKALQGQFKLFADYQKARQGLSFSSYHELGSDVYETWFNPVYNSDGLIESVIGFTINITKEKLIQDELKNTIKELTESKNELEHNKDRLEKLNRKLLQSEEELTKSNKGKDKFISILAHDIKSPLQGLINIASYLQMDYANIEGSELVELLGIISDSAEKINSLLDNLLLWIKIQNNTMPYSAFDDIYILEQINNIKDLFKPALLDKKIKIESSVSNTDSIYLDKYIFQIVLRNLISNAIKFSHFGGKIDVEFQTFDSYDVITVRDYGMGMTESKQKQLFDFTLMQSTPGTAKEKGAGLGLAICGELIEKMGGFINVKSELSRGTEISIGFPVRTR